MSTNKAATTQVNEVDNMFSKCYGAEGTLPKVSEEMKKFIMEKFLKNGKEGTDNNKKSEGIYSRWKIDSAEMYKQV